MALNYWGWQGDQTDIAKVLKPVQDDRNVGPEEMADFVKTYTDLDVIIRLAGTLDDLHRLLSAGFPTIVEIGYEDPKRGWLGHYLLLVGYDDSRRVLFAQDSLNGPNYTYDYDLLPTYWRVFNYLYLIVYPPDRTSAVIEALGPDMDETFNRARAVELARQETETLSGQTLAFAWFNLGTSLVALGDYSAAAAAYDQARYLGLPWRMLWYQTGPYQAYYFTQRYQDVIDLATQTITHGTYVEESWYWRGMAKHALGDQEGAIRDWKAALKYHPDWAPPLERLREVGMTP